MGLSWQVSTSRKVLVALLALLLAVTLVFAVIGPTIDGPAVNADAEASTVVAGWSFDGSDGDLSGGGGHTYSGFRAGPSWS